MEGYTRMSGWNEMIGRAQQVKEMSQNFSSISLTIVGKLNTCSDTLRANFKDRQSALNLALEIDKASKSVNECLKHLRQFQLDADEFINTIQQ